MPRPKTRFEQDTAKAVGEKFYVTGRPCQRGHITERYTASGSCVQCRKDADAAKYVGRWPGGATRTREEKSARAKQWKAANPERHKAHRLKVYGLSYADFVALWDRQGGRCAICTDELDGGKDTHVDHSHETGAVRGLLCNRCNLAIGLLRDSVGTALRAARYLRDALK